MPGFHTFLSSENRILVDEEFFKSELPTERSIFKSVYTSLNAVFCATSFDGYPLKFSHNDGILTIFEGAIYNFDENEIFEKISKASAEWKKCGNYKSIVSELVDAFDGDYVIQLFDTEHDKYLIFNDRLNRLPFYYSFADDRCSLSKDLRIILKMLPCLEIDEISLVDYLRFEYTFGNATLFKNVFRSSAASLIEIKIENRILIREIGRSLSFTFDLENQFKSKKEAVKALKKEFFESVRRRVEYAERSGTAIVADLSGGFDSRAIIGGLSKFSNKASYYTFQYTRDESVVSEPLFRSLGSPGNFVKLRYENAPADSSSIRNLVYLTDGLVNANTTYVCFRDVESYRNDLDGSAIRFGGLGGEYIRHPFMTLTGSIAQTVFSGINTSIPTILACRICKVPVKKYKTQKRKYFSSYPEKSATAKLRRLYDEYYRNYVTVAEERERNHFWITHPLQGGRLFEMMNKRIPLSWVGFEFFTEFLKEIDENLLKTPIFGKPIDLATPESLRKFDIEYRSQKSRLNYLRAVSKKNLSDAKKFVKKRLRRFFPVAPKKIEARKSNHPDYIDDYIQSRGTLYLFDKEQIIHSSKLLKLRSATIEMFLDSLSERIEIDFDHIRD